MFVYGMFPTLRADNYSYFNDILPITLESERIRFQFTFQPSMNFYVSNSEPGSYQNSLVNFSYSKSEPTIYKYLPHTSMSNEPQQ